MSDPLLARTAGARAAFLRRESRRLSELAREGQAPEVLFIGCSDSRVLAEPLMGARPGDLFVARVVANIVPPHTVRPNSVAAVVDFAVGRLGVREVVVCGHTDCGGVRQLQAGGASGSAALDDWLGHAAEALARVRARELPAEKVHGALVRENVLLQLERLRAFPSVNAALASGRLNLRGWVFDLAEQHIETFDAERGVWSRD